MTLEVIDAWKGTPPRELQVNLVGFTQQHAYVVGETVLAFLVEGTAYAQRLQIAQAQIEAEEEAQAEAEAEAEGDVDGNDRRRAERTVELVPGREGPGQREGRRRCAAFRGVGPRRWIENGLSEDARPARATSKASRMSFARPPVDGAGTGEADRQSWTLSALERPGMRDAMVIDMAELRTEKEPLTDSDLQRLARVFADAPSVGYADLPMLKLLSAYPDPAVDAAAASVVEAALRMDPIPDWGPAAGRHGARSLRRRLRRADRTRRPRPAGAPHRGIPRPRHAPRDLGRRSARPRHP